MPLNPPQDYRKTEFTHRIGLASARPSATDVLIGTLYFSSDTFILERSNGVIWSLYSGNTQIVAGSITSVELSDSINVLLASLPRMIIEDSIEPDLIFPPGLGTESPRFKSITLTDLAALTTAAESWVGPSTIAGIYFKAGNVGFGTTEPSHKVHLFSSVETVLAVDAAVAQNVWTYYKQANILKAAVGYRNSISALTLFESGADRLVIKNGNVCIGTTSPTAFLEIKAGTVSFAPFGLIAGIDLTTPLSGKFEYDGTNFHITHSDAIRNIIVPTIGLTNGRVPVAITTNSELGDYANFTYDGIILSAGKFVTASTIRLKNYTVATLPAGTQGDTAYVTDALAPTFLAIIVGGGTVITPVFFNGTNWVGF